MFFYDSNDILLCVYGLRFGILHHNLTLLMMIGLKYSHNRLFVTMTDLLSWWVGLLTNCFSFLPISILDKQQILSNEREFKIWWIFHSCRDKHLAKVCEIVQASPICERSKTTYYYELWFYKFMLHKHGQKIKLWSFKNG